MIHMVATAVVTSVRLDGVGSKIYRPNPLPGINQFFLGLAGPPVPQIMNQPFMTLAIAISLDGPIISPLGKCMIARNISAEALSGQDNFCINYFTVFRVGIFEYEILFYLVLTLEFLSSGQITRNETICLCKKFQVIATIWNDGGSKAPSTCRGQMK